MTTPNTLPPFCFVYMLDQPPGRRIGLVKLGELGFWPTDYDAAHRDTALVITVVDGLNKAMGVTRHQALAMECGSHFGWHIPAANPATWSKYDAQN